MANADVPTIDVTTLRDWLDRRRPVHVLDVRPGTDRAEWWIPGSRHIDAYDALWADDPNALADYTPFGNAPVVTVCTAGKTSILAARKLRGRGIDALSLEGGMQAWSLAWNWADVPLPNNSAQVVQVRRTGKGCLSYLLGADGLALVIDPSLPADVYLELAHARNWRITHVLETHVHADHLSRGRQLAQKTGAAYMLPANDRVQFVYTPIHDNEFVRVGSIELRSIATPGHTPESCCYLLNNTALLTGDTLSLAGVGRPDLLDASAAPTTHAPKAFALYRSLQRLRALPPETLMLPCHTNKPIPFDQQPIAGPLHEMFARFAPLLATEAAFVDHILARLPPTPANHQRIIEYNEAGQVPAEDATELEAGANRCAVA